MPQLGYGAKFQVLAFKLHAVSNYCGVVVR